MTKLALTKENQLAFINQELDRFASQLYNILKREAKEKSMHIPEETLRSLSYKIIEDRPELANEFLLTLPDSGRLVDMRRIKRNGRAITRDDNYISNWAKKRGLAIFRRRKIPGYKGKAENLSEEKKIERISSAIIVAKGSQNRRKPRRRAWKYNKIVYAQLAAFRADLRNNQAEFFGTAIKKDIEENNKLKF